MTSEYIIQDDIEATERGLETCVQCPATAVLVRCVSSMPNLAGEIDTIMEEPNNKKNQQQMEKLLRTLVTRHIEKAMDGNICVPQYVQRQRSDQEVLVYVGTHWVRADLQVFYDRIKEAAKLCGLPEVYAEDPRFMTLLYEQVQFRVMRSHKQQIPENETWMNMLNGTLVLNATTGETIFREHRREDNFLWYLPYAYEPDAQCVRFLAFMDEVLPDKDAQSLLLEHIAFPFVKNLKLEKLLVLLGKGCNGKSVLTDLMIELFGRANVSQVDLALLTSDPNYRSEAVGKLVNISQENSSGINWAVLKTMVSGESVTVKRLYRDPYPTNDYGKLVAVYNQLPKPEVTHGNFRRWNILPFLVTISEEKRDVQLKQKLMEELPGILNLVIEALRRLIKNQAFTHCALSQHTLENYIRESNSALLFFDEKCVLADDGRVKTTELYASYLGFCRDENMMPLGKTKFKQHLTQIGMREFASNGVRYYNVKYKAE